MNSNYSISCHSSQLFSAVKPRRNSWWLLCSTWVCFSSFCFWFFSYFTAIASQFISISSWKKTPQTAKLLYLLSCFWLHLWPVLQQSENYANLFLSLTINVMFKHYCCHIGCVFICCSLLYSRHVVQLILLLKKLTFTTTLSLCYWPNLFSFHTNRLICCSTCLATEFLSPGSWKALT